ncbi:MAG: hypothetical protein ACLTT1_07865 [[Clostridium] scindens]
MDIEIIQDKKHILLSGKRQPLVQGTSESVIRETTGIERKRQVVDRRSVPMCRAVDNFVAVRALYFRDSGELAHEPDGEAYRRKKI